MDTLITKKDKFSSGLNLVDARYVSALDFVVVGTPGVLNPIYYIYPHLICY